MEKKKVLLFTYSKANFGDDLFVYILANRYKNIEFYIQIQEPKYKKAFVEAELLRSPVGKFPRRPQPLRDLLLAFSVLRGGGEDLLQIQHDLGLRAAGDMQVLSDLPDILFFHLASSVC